MHHGGIEKGSTNVINCIFKPVLRIQCTHPVVKQDFSPPVVNETINAVSIFLMNWILPMLRPFSCGLVAVIQSFASEKACWFLILPIDLHLNHIEVDFRLRTSHGQQLS